MTNNYYVVVYFSEGCLKVQVLVDGRPVVRVRELADMMGVCPHTVFNYIRREQVKTVLLNPRDRRVFLDSVVGKENVQRAFIDVGRASEILKLTRSRIYHHIRQGAFDHVIGPGGLILLFVDRLTFPDFSGRELVTVREARRITGLPLNKLDLFAEAGLVSYVRLASGSKRYLSDTLISVASVEEDNGIEKEETVTA